MQRPSLSRLIPLSALIALCFNAQADQADPAAILIANSSHSSSVAPVAVSQEWAAASPASPIATSGQLQTVDTQTHIQTNTQTDTQGAAGEPLRTLDLTIRPDDIWERVRHGFAVPNIDSPLVAVQQAWFLSHGDYLRRAVSRSSRYLYHIVEELEKRGMPTELALLPFIESAYNPMAYSTAQASGMWQFIPSTGKDYNLKQNWWQDERRDVIASTDAALTYLQKIYEMHGDWHLALASYNWGEGSVKRAIDRNLAAGLPADYLSLKMPDETRNYIPKLQAFKNIIANPELFGITLPKIDNQPYFAAVGNNQSIDLATAARLAQMPLDEFKALNPSFNRPMIPASANATLLLPADRVEIFEANLENSVDPLVTWQAYVPKRGESLSKVAKHFGMDLTYLQQINGITSKSRLRPHTVLLVQNSAKREDSDRAMALPADQAQFLSYSVSSATKKSSARKVAGVKAVSKVKAVSASKATVRLAAKK